MAGEGRKPRSRVVFVLMAVGAFLVALVQPELGRRYVSRLFDRAERAAGADDLAVAHEWPLRRGCDAATAVAMPEGGPAPSDIVVNEREDARREVVARGGGAWGNGGLNLYLSARGDKVLHVTDIAVVVYKTFDEPPGWVLASEGGCGAAYERVFAVRLDERRPTVFDMGLVGSAAPADMPPRTEPLGPTFTVSAQDPAHIRVAALACARSYEWGLRITYVVGGETRTTTIGSRERPLRLLGQETARWLTQDGTRLRPIDPQQAHQCVQSGDSLESSLKRFLYAWWIGDRERISAMATDQALRNFSEDPHAWADYRLRWDPMTCFMGSSGAGGCNVDLISPGGRATSFLISYHEENNPEGIVINEITRS